MIRDCAQATNAAARSSQHPGYRSAPPRCRDPNPGFGSLQERERRVWVPTGERESAARASTCRAGGHTCTTLMRVLASGSLVKIQTTFLFLAHCLNRPCPLYRGHVPGSAALGHCRKPHSHCGGHLLWFSRFASVASGYAGIAGVGGLAAPTRRLSYQVAKYRLN